MEQNAEVVKQQPPQTIEVIESEDQVLRYTQRKRQEIVERLLNLSTEQLEGSDKTMLLGALDGMDRAALGRKRLKTDEKIGASQAAAAALIAKVLSAPGIPQALQGVSTRGVPVLPSSVPEPLLVPGELDNNASQMDFDTFMAQSPVEGLSQQE